MGVYDSIEEVRKEFKRKTITPYKEKYFSLPTAYYQDNKENKTIEYFISVTSSISKAKINEWEVYDWLITKKTLCDTKRR